MMWNWQRWCTCLSFIAVVPLGAWAQDDPGHDSAGSISNFVVTQPTGTDEVLGSRGEVSPHGSLYGGFQLNARKRVYLLVRGDSLNELGITNNYLGSPHVRLYNASGIDMATAQNGLPGFTYCLADNPLQSAVVNYYASVRGVPVHRKDACVEAFLPAGVYTFQIQRSIPLSRTLSANSTPSSGEVLFELTTFP